ncbi:unnamed protein product [Cyprideis torosa]|uniref:Uncharacterized protein n=1 Tax=Cyprideis torosa TaxID=163714 RepID=A0A7R8ZSG8_9CRUS|nr:unnamed protein product [Cyprideis torosa]CAG0895514.1 unnamed protein product [Cyprideis torosa]
MSRHQTAFVNPVIEKFYDKIQEKIIQKFQGKKITLTADGRSCSPGSSAKYTQVTFMCVTSKAILHFELFQVSMSKNSVTMERDAIEVGLKKCMEIPDIEVEGIVTDRSPSVAKLIREQFKTVRHHFDPWHITKSVKTQLLQVGKQKGYELVGQWCKSITNHLWYSMQTCGKDYQTLIRKWTSLLHHITDKHEWSDGRCEHEDLDDEDDEYFTPETLGLDEIKDIVLKPRLLQQLEKATHFYFTSALEAYHSLLLKYATKRLHYHFAGMRARSMISVIDHNWNIKRPQAINKKTGEPRFQRRWSKKTKAWIVSPVKVPKNYNFRRQILAMCFEKAASEDSKLAETVTLRSQDIANRFKIPRNVVSIAGPPKEELVKDYLERKRKSVPSSEEEGETEEEDIAERSEDEDSDDEVVLRMQ